MTDSPDNDLDGRMRRAAHESLDAHRRSIERSDIESALQAAQAPASHVAGRSRGRRRAVAALAAAAVVALVGALVLVTGGSSDEQVSVATTSSQIEDVPTTPRSTSASGTDLSTSVAPREILVETVAFDADGEPLVGFDENDVDVVADRSAFADVLRDYLINGSDILGESAAEREQQLDAGGLRIHTTLDSDTQAAAESARTELPSNSLGIDAAIVSLDTTSGAVRAMIGAPNVQADDRRVNMAVTPRQTGSAVGSFIIAAAVEAGAQADDQIDARRGCRFPSDPPEFDFEINGGVVGFVGSIRDVTARGVLCGTTRLSLIVGLENVVDTIYRMAASPYLDPAGSTLDRSRLEPFPALAVGANEMSPLDMASGMQTLANEGVHHDPYFVEYIDDAAGNRIYTHLPDGTRELERDTSLETIDILKGVLLYGTGRRNTLPDDRPAFGVTGTQENNTNAWFVGATPQLATAVWVGDPDAYTPMIEIPEFEAAGVVRVQGGTFPAQIWKAFTDGALDGTPSSDWPDPPPPARPNARLVLAGVECRLLDPTTEPSPTNTPQQIDPEEPITTVDVSSIIVPCD